MDLILGRLTNLRWLNDGRRKKKHPSNESDWLVRPTPHPRVSFGALCLNYLIAPREDARRHGVCLGVVDHLAVWSYYCLLREVGSDATPKSFPGIALRTKFDLRCVAQELLE